MLRILFTSFILFLMSCSPKNSQTPTVFETGVSFGSICCGTASDNFLKSFYAGYHDKVKAWKIDGCGKEGEYHILFSTTTLSDTEKMGFVNTLTDLVLKEDQKNKAENSSSGSINVESNVSAGDLQFCRGKLSPWK